MNPFISVDSAALLLHYCYLLVDLFLFFALSRLVGRKERKRGYRSVDEESKARNSIELERTGLNLLAKQYRNNIYST